MKFVTTLLTVILLPYAAAFAEDGYYSGSKYTVSATGRFIAATYRSRDIGSRLVIVDTSAPASRQVVGDDYPRFPGVAFSDDEHWIVVTDLGSDSSDSEATFIRLLHRESGTKFEPATSPDFKVLTARVHGSSMSILSAEWGSGSDHFVVDVIQRLGADSDQYQFWQVLSGATEPGKPGQLLTGNQFDEKGLVALTQTDMGREAEKQLNSVYVVLKKNLDRTAQADLTQEEKQWLVRRDNLPSGFDQTYFTERRTNALVLRLLTLQGTINHLDNDATPSFAEFLPSNSANEKVALHFDWGDRADSFEPSSWQAAVNNSGALGVLQWLDSSYTNRLAIGRRIQTNRYRIDLAAGDEIKTKVLSAILQTQKLALTTCESSELKPDAWADEDNVAISGRAAGHSDKLASYSATGWTVLYNIKKQEVVKISNPGKFDSVPKEATPATAKDGTKETHQKDQESEPDPTLQGSEVSPDGVVKLLFRHLSTGNWIDVVGNKKNGDAVMDSLNADSSIFKDAFALHGLNQSEDLGAHYGTTFEGWSGRGHQFVVALHAQLSNRGPHGAFYRFTGWSGLYDPDTGQIVKQLTEGSFWEPL
jgi:hypothetical protein